ncbi:MAG TPA: MarR family winged helix-turn-helix transcriptional regulator [Dongiaceae bacterium]|nr:MarR family winged helix-turn-helix transcriptional regulator [Dongiaceae bacterium]
MMHDESLEKYPDYGCACAALRRAARSATQLYDLVLQPTGLKVTQFIALRSIDKAGELQQWRFAQEHAIAVETLSRRLSVLRRKGLVSVRVGKNHGERIYALTEEGRKALAEAIPYWERAQSRLARTLGESEFGRLLQFCDTVTGAAHKAEELRAANATENGADQGAPAIPLNGQQIMRPTQLG